MTPIQVFVIVFAFASSTGERHTEQIPRVFTTEHSCEVTAKRVMKVHYERIPGLYWWCEPTPLYGPQRGKDNDRNIHI